MSFQTRSEKSRLPLDKIPNIVKSSAFMRQEWAKYPHPSSQQQKELLSHAIAGGICTTIGTFAGWPLLVAALFRSLYRRYRNH